MMIERRGLDDFASPEISGGVQRAHAYWHGKAPADVRQEMPSADHISIADGRVATYVELPALTNDSDEQRTTVLSLPYLNSYTPHHYMRLKTLQLVAAPDQRMILLPNNSYQERSYDLTAADRKRMRSGSIAPLGELGMRTLEALNACADLGDVAWTGYSQGAAVALAGVRAGSSSVSVTAVNADETPSKRGRTCKQLGHDLAKSGNPAEFKAAISDSHIGTLKQVMHPSAIAADLLRFGLQSLKAESKDVAQSMTGSMAETAHAVASQGVPVKLGFIAGSRLFDPEDIEANAHLRVVEYSGHPFNRKHATGDNIIAHALMAQDGIVCP